MLHIGKQPYITGNFQGIKYTSGNFLGTLGYITAPVIFSRGKAPFRIGDIPLATPMADT